MPTTEEEEEAPMDERASTSGVCLHDDLPLFFGEIAVGESDGGAPDLDFFLEGDESTTSAAFAGGSCRRNALLRATDIK